MNAARPKAALRDFKPATRSCDDVVERHAHIRKAHLAVSKGRVIRTKHRHHALDLHARRIQWNQNHRMPLIPRGGTIGYAHKDEQPAVGMAESGTPPLQSI